MVRGRSISLSTPPWMDQQRKETLWQGPHKLLVKYADFLCKELLDFIWKGFWMVLPYWLLQKDKHLIQNLGISSLGVGPSKRSYRK
jgi:hypothetical protein